MINFISKDNLLYIWQKIKLLLSAKVDKVEGKGLSTNDLTDELKEKILNAGDSSFTGNYNDLINKPTKLSEFTNDTNFQNADEVSLAIASAISGITEFDYAIVETLPETGIKGTIYLVPKQGEEDNLYDEYLYVDGKPEPIGKTTIDLSEYVKKTDLVEVTNEEIDAIFAS